MEVWIKKIGILLGAMLGVVLIMCLVAKVMTAADSERDTEYNEAMEKLAGGSTQKENADASGSNSDKVSENEQSPDNSSGAKDNSAVTENDTNSDTAAESSKSGNNADAGKDSETDKGSTSGQTAGSSAGEEPAGQESASAGEKTSSSGKGHTVVIDAAHQQKVDTDKEPIGPGSSETKYKITSGATGVSTGVPEYKLVLEIALALRDELVFRGYDVYMTREVNDVSLSDSERAKLANDKGEIVVHIHANADEREGIAGTMAFYPSANNAFVASKSAECKALCSDILSGLNAATGASSWGCIANDNLTALNWTKIPAAHIEVGYMSNPDEDKLMQTSEYQHKIVRGLADGIDLYFDK